MAFRQINKKTGNRLRQQLVDDETREPVEAADKGQGYEYAKGSYLMIEDDELEAIEIESNRTIEVDSVRATRGNRRTLSRHPAPYYIAPNEPVGQEAFAVIREAMRGKNMVALGRVVLSKRERVILLHSWTTLRYPHELREAKDYFYDIPDVKVEPELLTLAQHILKTKEARFDPARFVDRYEQAVLQMLGEEEGRPARRSCEGVCSAPRRAGPVRGVQAKPSNGGRRQRCGRHAGQSAQTEEVQAEGRGPKGDASTDPGKKTEEKKPVPISSTRRKAG